VPAVVFLIGATATEEALRAAVKLYDNWASGDHPEHGCHDGALLQAVGGSAVRHTADGNEGLNLGAMLDEYGESQAVVHQLRDHILMPEPVK
jgi:hypothetical protein